MTFIDCFSKQILACGEQFHIPLHHFSYRNQNHLVGFCWNCRVPKPVINCNIGSFVCTRTAANVRASDLQYHPRPPTKHKPSHTGRRNRSNSQCRLRCHGHVFPSPDAGAWWIVPLPALEVSESGYGTESWTNIPPHSWSHRFGVRFLAVVQALESNTKWWWVWVEWKKNSTHRHNHNQHKQIQALAQPHDGAKVSRRWTVQNCLLTRDWTFTHDCKKSRMNVIWHFSCDAITA